MTGLARRLSWIAAAPFLAAATLATVWYTAATLAAETIIEYGDTDDDGDDQ